MCNNCFQKKEIEEYEGDYEKAYIKYMEKYEQKQAKISLIKAMLISLFIFVYTIGIFYIIYLVTNNIILLFKNLK